MKAEDVRRQALELTDHERAELAAELLVSLEQPHPATEPREAWAAELERRARSVMSGQAQTVPWETARQTVVNNLTE